MAVMKVAQQRIVTPPHSQKWPKSKFSIKPQFHFEKGWKTNSNLQNYR